MFGVPMESILGMLAGASLGLAVHVMAKTAEIREKDDSSMTAWRYFAMTPMKTLTKGVLVLVVALALAPDQMTWVIFGAAVNIGYNADSVINHLGRLKI